MGYVLESHSVPQSNSSIGIVTRLQKCLIQINILKEFDGKCLHTAFNRCQGQSTTLKFCNLIFDVYHIQGHMGTKFWENKGWIEEFVGEICSFVYI